MMNTSQIPLVLAAVLAVSGSALTHSQDGGTKPAPLTLSRALKLGPEKLAEQTDGSEAGQDRAAHLYAAAKRIETESALAQRDLEQVVVLDSWRDAISACRRGSCSLAYIVNGGGSMYSHGQARDCAEVEDFLAVFAKSLPLPEGKGSAKAAKQAEGAISFLKNLKIFESGDADADKKSRADLADEVKRVSEAWEKLKYMIGELPSEQAVKVASFAANSLGWLKEGE